MNSNIKKINELIKRQNALVDTEWEHYLDGGFDFEGQLWSTLEILDTLFLEEVKKIDSDIVLEVIGSQF
ncbi:MAG: hypothetical protein ACRCUM_03840 [Mycoplasmoidaceae bacterium]